MTVNSQAEKNFCPNYVQDFGLCTGVRLTTGPKLVAALYLISRVVYFKRTNHLKQSREEDKYIKLSYKTEIPMHPFFVTFDAAYTYNSSSLLWRSFIYEDIIECILINSSRHLRAKVDTSVHI